MIKLDSQEQEKALAAVIAAPKTRLDVFTDIAQKLNAANYTGGSSDALRDVFKKLEGTSNNLVDQEQDAVDQIAKNIEISEQVMKAAYLQNRVQTKSMNGKIDNKKNVNLTGKFGM